MNKQKMMFVGLIFSFIISHGYSQTTLNKQNIENTLNDAFNKFKDVKEGKNADYIKELANVDPNIFGIALVTADGTVYTKGDITSMVSIQSISKVFTMAKVIEQEGPQFLQEKIGVNATGLPFNSIVAIEMRKGDKINPLVNPGAIATTSLIRGNDSVAKWKEIQKIQSDFAGRQLSINRPVYISEASDNLRNQAIAHLLLAYNRIYFDPVQATDLYTKQCALNVNVKDLATMAATLANGGVNPVTKNKVVSQATVMYTLPVMATAGLYDNSGIWLFNSGLPAKSGVGGGILAVCPGKFGIAVISPPLDESGNSLKAQKVIQYVVEKLKANPYLIDPK
ncbi:glutaminase A [Flavobacterium sharifuzzamanii]|uniref:glutaminase A n=1 Tax=Flavobacterium sharifuzzamanii TaxID=2211133 RepID=UPI000DAE9E96|nr:glutaminase A [Flavobacterium sharifuzzamanii]KAF2079521.1 glutaminase A [Flavobacterium sharifuzzamanii]